MILFFTKIANVLITLTCLRWGLTPDPPNMYKGSTSSTDRGTEVHISKISPDRFIATGNQQQKCNYYQIIYRAERSDSSFKVTKNLDQTGKVMLLNCLRCIHCEILFNFVATAKHYRNISSQLLVQLICHI